MKLGSSSALEGVIGITMVETAMEAIIGQCILKFFRITSTV
jgi:hypothetical protein